jgi:hypothetical protein
MVARGAQSTIGGGKDHYASGPQSTVAGGQQGTASGTASTIAGGYGNSATNTYTSALAGRNNYCSGIDGIIAGGSANSAGGQGSAVLGGEGNSASAIYSSVLGGAYGKAELYGKFAHASDRFASTGDAQFGRMVLRGATADAATPKILTANAGTASTANTIVLRNNGVYSYQIELVANSAVVGSGSVYGTWGGNWSLSGLIRRTATAATTALIGTPSVTAANIDSAISACAVTLTANVTLGGLEITVTGVASTNIRWVAVVTTTEVG